MQTEKNRQAPQSRRLTIFASLALSALLGTLIGALCCLYTNVQLAQLLCEAEEKYFTLRRSGDLSAILFSSFLTSGSFLLVCYILGFSAIAQPFEFFLPFLRGLSCGVTLTQIYGSSFSADSALKAAAVLPGIFLSLVILLLACREALYMSNRLLGVCLRDTLLDGLFSRVKLYSIRFLVFLAAASAASAVDCALAMLLLGKI